MSCFILTVSTKKQNLKIFNYFVNYCDYDLILAKIVSPAFVKYSEYLESSSVALETLWDSLNHVP